MDSMKILGMFKNPRNEEEKDMSPKPTNRNSLNLLDSNKKLDYLSILNDKISKITNYKHKNVSQLATTSLLAMREKIQDETTPIIRLNPMNDLSANTNLINISKIDVDRSKIKMKNTSTDKILRSINKKLKRIFRSFRTRRQSTK